MANNEKMINEILRAIGGKENIVSATHCITRLRFHLVDAKKADIETVKKIDGVVGCVYKAGQFQVIIGPHVNEVYNDLIQVTGLKNEPAVDAEPACSTICRSSLHSLPVKSLNAIPTCR